MESRRKWGMQILNEFKFGLHKTGTVDSQATKKKLENYLISYRNIYKKTKNQVARPGFSFFSIKPSSKSQISFYEDVGSQTWISGGSHA